MTVFRVPKHGNYTVMSNQHLRNKEISLKSKGLMSLMLSLPDDWDYTQAGLTMFCRDGIDSIRSAVSELENKGYLKRRKVRNEHGQFIQTEYSILEEPESEKDRPYGQPIPAKPVLEISESGNPTTERPIPEKTTQLNTDKPRTERQSTEKQNINQSIRDGWDGNIPIDFLRDPVFEEKPVEIDAAGETARREAYQKVIQSNIEYDNLIFDHPNEKGRIDELIMIILDVLFYKKDRMMIGDLEVPTEVVRSRLFHLNHDHIEYVMYSLDQNRTEIRNIKKYLLSVLYHAPSTIDSYYMAKVGAEQM